VEKGDTLNHETVKVHGDVFQSREIGAFGDRSMCTSAKKQPCKISFALGKCRISGKRYAGLNCLDGLRRLEDSFSFPFDRHASIVIKDVRIEGILSTVREDLTPAEPGLPRIGFGHLGIFPAELSATKIDLDKSTVEIWRY
jgi:hypothetical protein